MWLIDAFGAAVSNAAFGIEQKKLSARTSPLVLAVFTRIWALPLTIAALLALPQPWSLHPGFWAYLLVCSTLTALGTYLTYVAYQNLDFSLAFPLLSVSPAIALLSAWSIDKVTPSPVGIFGVLLVAIGTYFLASEHHRVVIPLSNPGTWAILTVAILYSVTTSYDKLGVQASSPAVWTLAVTVAIIAIQLPIVWASHNIRPPRRKKHIALSPFWLVGTLAASVMLFQMYSLQAGAYVPYLLAVKQLSVIIAVIAGWYALKERRSPHRFWSAVIVTFGVIVISVN